MANNFDSERQLFIEKLKATEKLFDDLFKLDNNGMVIDVNERQYLEKLQKRNKAILNKLESRKFNIAIVGLEKAGKSTLCNALLKQNILPAEPERTTFVKTQIIAGDNDEVEIRFLTKSEFDKRLQGLFESVKYEGTPSLPEFNKYWETVDLSSELYFIHNDKTVRDIRNILEGWDTISKLLNHEPIIFTDKKDIEKQAKIYITGIIGFKTGYVLERGAEPYAVERVIIRTTQLSDMGNIVLYDVPDFDSPTLFHRNQTQEMLMYADAIILVNNSGTNPNLTGSQLDIFRSVRDEDGILLNQKAFVFGNRIDLVSSKEQVNNRMAILEKEAVKTYQLVSSKDRVLIGSARSYLEKIGCLNSTVCMDKLDSWNIPYGVDELRQKMQEYYDTDRFAILKNRAENTIDKIKVSLQDIIAKYPRLDDIDVEIENNKIRKDIVKSIDEVLKNLNN